MVEKEKAEEAARIEAENKKRQLCPAAKQLPVQTTVKYTFKYIYLLNSYTKDILFCIHIFVDGIKN